MAFLTKEQMKTHVRTTVGDLIARGDDDLLQSAIDTAVNEAKGYLSRYNTDILLDNIDNDISWKADPTLHYHCKNMAKWHFIGVANANIDYEDALTRYEKAIKWLEGIQAGKIVPQAWPPAQPIEHATFFHTSSNPKRGNHF